MIYVGLREEDMGAFILAGLVFLITLAFSVFVFMGDMMSDETGLNGTSAGWWLLGGTVVSVAVASTHWLHIGW